MDTNLVAVQMELTNACKLACAECPRILMSRPVGVMKLELAKLLVDDGVAYRADMGFNVNGLGEPLLYPHFAELVQYMDSRRVAHMDLFTSLICPERLFERALIALQATRMHVTVAITKHLYDNHGKRQFEDDEFDRRVESILGLTSNVDRHIGIVLTKYHQPHDELAFVARFRERFDGAHFHIIRRLNPWFNLVKDMAHPDHGPDPGCLKREVCEYPFILLHVGWNGDVILCCTDDVDAECILGRISKPGDLREVWHGPQLEAMRSRHRNFDIDFSPCNKCARTAWARQAA